MTARIAVLDIERISAIVENVWDLGQKSYIQPSSIIEPSRTICLAWKWTDAKKIHFASEWDDTHEGMIRKAHAVLDECDYLVGWNSRAFDVKHLKSHFLQYGLTPPSPHIDIDLMVNVKREFKFMSNRMAYIADVLGIDGKADTGHGLWRDLRSDSPGVVTRARKQMAKYNKRDVELTEELFEILRPWLRNLNLGLYTDTDEPQCPNCNSTHLQSRGEAGNLTYRYRRFQCQDCGKWGRHNKSVAKVEVAGI